MSSSGPRALGKHVAHELDALLEHAERSEATRRALAERAAKPAGQRSPWWVRWAPIAAAAAVGAVAGLLVPSGFLREPELTFTVGDAARPGVLRAWESAPPGGTLPIRFSDGTTVSLGSDARARVVRVGSSGADVVIESGRASVSVVPNAGRSWSVQSGPFVVEVKGTKFDVGWDPRAAELTLRLFEGRVMLTGCGLGEGRLVEAGQEVHESCKSPDAAAPSEAPASAASSEPGPAPAPEVAQPGPAPAPATSAAPETWRKLSRDGHYARAYEIAAKAGFAVECDGADAGDLLMLGDAARLSGQSRDAHHAYTTLRRRFPGSEPAARAAFALGQLALQGGSAESAADAFGAYLNERPSGPLSAAALDRLMEAAARIGDRSRRRAIAAAYLARSPTGPRAGDARRMLDDVEPSPAP